jgi:hypothetical protein
MRVKMERSAREKRRIVAICVYVRDEVSCGDGIVKSGRKARHT